MRKQIQVTWLALALAIVLTMPALRVRAQTVEITRVELGSGEPGQRGVEEAHVVGEGMYHAPQYLPGSPTAASLWPRVLDVRCRPDGAALRCEGYHWSPAMGRAEYLYFVPVVIGPDGSPVR